MPSTRNVSRTSANLNGIPNARFAGLPLADTDGRGRGAARTAVKTRDGLFIHLREGEREGWGKFLPCRDSAQRLWRRRRRRCCPGSGRRATARSRRFLRCPLSRLASAARRRSSAASCRRPRIIARRRSAPAIRMSCSPDWRRCPARKSLR